MNAHTVARNDRLRRLAGELRQRLVPTVPDSAAGRGIVVVAGGARIFTNAYVLLAVLRRTLKSALPVELWYFGQGEISPAMAALLVPFDVRLVDAVPILRAEGSAVRDGWQLKSFALLHCGFSEALLLDADQVPVRDPAELFDWPQYRASGAVFWPDIVDVRTDNEVWAVMGLAPRRAVSFESGQVLVDRRRHLPALRAAAGLNAAADDLYQLIYGDKDAFLLAWSLLGAEFALVPHRPFVDNRYLVQRDFDGNALFQHLTGAKWLIGEKPLPLADIVHYQACLSALAELEAAWSGDVFCAPDRSAGARAVEDELIRQADFELEVVDEAPIMLQLRAHAEIGPGRDHDRRHWWVEGNADRTTLVLGSATRRTYEFSLTADGLWRGRRQRPPFSDASLTPIAAWCPDATAGDRPGLVDDLVRAGGLDRASDAEQQRLADSLALLARVIPGVAKRLMLLAAAADDPQLKRRLESLAAAVAATEIAAKPVVKRAALLVTGYQKMDQP